MTIKSISIEDVHNRNQLEAGRLLRAATKNGIVTSGFLVKLARTEERSKVRRAMSGCAIKLGYRNLDDLLDSDAAPALFDETPAIDVHTDAILGQLRKTPTDSSAIAAALAGTDDIDDEPEPLDDLDHSDEPEWVEDVPALDPSEIPPEPVVEPVFDVAAALRRGDGVSLHDAAPASDFDSAIDAFDSAIDSDDEQRAAQTSTRTRIERPDFATVDWENAPLTVNAPASVGKPYVCRCCHETSATSDEQLVEIFGLRIGKRWSARDGARRVAVPQPYCKPCKQTKGKQRPARARAAREAASAEAAATGEASAQSDETSIDDSTSAAVERIKSGETTIEAEIAGLLS